MESIYHSSYITLAQTLKTTREAAGLTQAQLGKLLGRDQTFVSKYESRERRLDIIEVRDICHVLNFPLTDLLNLLEVDLPNEGVMDELTVDSPESEIAADGGGATHHFVSTIELDREWSQTEWKRLIDWFVETGILSYQEIGALMLGHLNPPQVGTSIASKATFQQHHAKRQTWQAVKAWFYEQAGRCEDCNTRLELQADHIVPRQEEGDAADRLSNMTLRCRRCNVIRRPSHKRGGQTFLTTESALMWILFVRRPSTYADYKRLCREYGLTMADIRFQEAWAMAQWLAREGLYELDEVG